MQKTFIDKLAYICLKNGKILCTLSKGKSVWYIPGGKREGNETDEQALIREVKEELSVDLVKNSIKKYGVFEDRSQKSLDDSWDFRYRKWNSLFLIHDNLV